MPSCRPVHVVVVACSNLKILEFFFFAAQRNSPERQRVHGAAWNVVELASDGQRGGARSPDPKPTTADTMVPLPTSGGAGVMLRRAGQPSPPVMEPIGNRMLSVGSNYDVHFSSHSVCRLDVLSSDHRSMAALAESVTQHVSHAAKSCLKAPLLLAFAVSAPNRASFRRSIA